MGDLLYRFRGWILGLAALALLVVPGATLEDNSLPASICAGLLLLSSAVLRIQARRSIGEHTRGYVHDADALVTTGVYSRMRHPLYVSNAGIALAAIFWHFGLNFLEDFSPQRSDKYVTAAAFAIFICIFELILSRMEDRFLQKRFGAEWTSWAAITPAFFPSLKNYKQNKIQYNRSFSQAFLADKSTWFWIAVAFAILTAKKFF